MPARCASPTRDGEAIEIFERLHPAIVITDWVMPDLTGIELCHKIRADVHAAYTYIIILTSNAERRMWSKDSRPARTITSQSRFIATNSWRA